MSVVAAPKTITELKIVERVFPCLTPQQKNIAQLWLREGKITKELANDLFISDRTVEFHKNQIRRKFSGFVKDPKNLVQLVLYVERNPQVVELSDKDLHVRLD